MSSKVCRPDLEKGQTVTWLQKHMGQTFRTKAKVRSVSESRVCVLVKFENGWKRRYAHPADIV